MSWSPLIKIFPTLLDEAAPMIPHIFYFFFFDQFSLLICLPLPTPKASSGISLVIVEPAPTYAFLPILIGATSDEFVPMKEPSPILVLCLSFPS